ncbi:hypothetical protein NM688_g234 [Phlebia brevispora]|uniref:Uncharacterized protein n=1 Tax=Phlebia brevispora TaxID=194682 RepID=A0ACC1TF83_9APHY|nr:hypothetical protein NM688_g234 [Phlebia brevispora]
MQWACPGMASENNISSAFQMSGHLLLAGELVARNYTLASNGKPILIPYTPSYALTAIAFVAYGLIALIFSWNMWKHGGKYMLAMVIGCYIYAVGIAMRFPLHNNRTSLILYIIESLFVTLAPCGFIATEYMILGRLAAWLRCTRHLLIPANRVTFVFVMSDVISFGIQGGGAGLLVNPSIASIGTTILLIGMIIQLISFCIFVAVLFRFMYKVHQEEQSAWMRDGAKSAWNDWRFLAYAVCISSVGVLIRNFYRVVEMSQGSNGHLQSTEGYFYGLDTLPLFCALSVYVLFWPGRFIPDGINLKEVHKASEEERLGMHSAVALKDFED